MKELLQFHLKARAAPPSPLSPLPPAIPSPPCQVNSAEIPDAEIAGFVVCFDPYGFAWNIKMMPV